MEHKTTGTVIAAKKQWWLKINTKPIRHHAWDGAIFPYIITVRYTVHGTEYHKRKWIKAGKPVPSIGATVTVYYDLQKPTRARIYTIL